MNISNIQCLIWDDYKEMVNDNIIISHQINWNHFGFDFAFYTCMLWNRFILMYNERCTRLLSFLQENRLFYIIFRRFWSHSLFSSKYTRLLSTTSFSSIQLPRTTSSENALSCIQRVCIDILKYFRGCLVVFYIDTNTHTNMWKR